MEDDILKSLFSGIINNFSGDKLKGMFDGLNGLFGNNFIVIIVLVVAFLLLAL